MVTNLSATARVGAIGASEMGATTQGSGSTKTTAPEATTVPISRSVESAALVYMCTLGEASVCLADGVGPGAGMKCVVLAKAD